jgi:hypothetical protein
MVMGPTHAMSGAAASLGTIVGYTAITGMVVHPTVAIMATAVAAGAALAPDIDSGRSTVVNSFGIFGKAAHHVANSVSVAIYNITKTSKETARTDGHRTLFHTTIAAIAAGVGVSLLTLPTNIIQLFGREYTLGQLNAIILLGIFINLAFSGLLEKPIKKARKQYGPYLLMLMSFTLAAIVAFFVPHPEESNFGLTIFGSGTYAYLGLAVAFGWFVHLLGDAITKMGVPMAWPIKIRNKRWYDISLPAFMRIKADGIWNTILLVIFSIATVFLFGYLVAGYMRGV